MQKSIAQNIKGKRIKVYGSEQVILDGPGAWSTFKSEILIDLIPVPKPRMTRWDTWKPAAKRYFAFADKLRELAPAVNWETLEVRFVMPMPKSWSIKKKMEMRNKPHRQVPDLDNLVKAFKDALLEQDSEVWHYQNVQKVWGYRGGIAVGARDV